MKSLVIAKHPDGNRQSALRRLWARLLWWRFRLFQSRRYNRLVLEHIDGRPFVILPQVFNPALFEASTFLARTLNSITLAPDTSVLDLRYRLWPERHHGRTTIALRDGHRH